MCKMIRKAQKCSLTRSRAGSQAVTRLKRIYEADFPRQEDLVYLLSLGQDRQSLLFDFADKVRAKFMGEGILLRGIIEFSNFCKNSCFYCGINNGNHEIKRYRLEAKEILNSVKQIAESGVKTVVLQSGEDSLLDSGWFRELIEEIKTGFDIAITLCVGERAFQDYKIWKKSGADRYLLKIETSNKVLYESLHPGMSFENRVRCLKDLKSLGYQTGSGNIIGLKGQTISDLAKDIIFFKKEGFEMIGIGPFIPHKKTNLSCQPHADAALVIKSLALTRIVTRYAHLPATTALGSLERDFRIDALKAGANVLMPNFTPQPYRKLYEIYPGKRCVDEPVGFCKSCMENLASSINRSINYSRGDGTMTCVP